MAKRKASAGMSGARKKKRTGRTGRKARVPRAVSTYGTVYKIRRREERFVDLSVISTMSTGFNSQGITFTLNQLQNKSDFANLFDQFRITKIHVEMYLVNNPDAGQNFNSTTVANSSNWWPILYYDNDKEDSTPPTLAQFKQRMGVKRRRISNMAFIKYSFVPTVLTALVNSSGSQATAMPITAPWVNMDASGTVHYGFKWGLDCFTAPGSAQAYTVRCEFIYDVEFKGVGRI